MNINQILQDTNAIDSISREFGIDPKTAETGAAALMPTILSAFQQPAGPADPSAAGGTPGAGGAQEPGGLGALLGTIRQLGGGALLDNVTSAGPTELDKGNQILGHLFGSKEGSRAVATQAAAQSGVPSELLKKMLPALTMAAAGYVAKQAGQSGGQLGSVMGDLLGGQAAQGAGNQQSQSQADVLGSLIGAAGKFFAR